MTNDKFYLVDTNVWISNLDELKQFDNLVVTGAVLRELDKLKSSSNQQLAFDSRNATRYIKENKDKFKFDLVDYDAESILGEAYDNGYADNRIVAQAYVNGYGVISNDINVQFKAIGLGLDVREIDKVVDIDDDYKGFIEIEMTQEEFEEFRDNDIDENKYNLLINQYLIINEKDSGRVIQAYRWDGEYHLDIKSKPLRSMQMGDFKPKDIYQQCAIDAMINNDIIMFRGKAGTAKTLLMISYAMQQLQAGKYDKLIVFTNNLPVKNSFYNGLLKGSLKDKLLSSSIGNILASKLGSFDQVEAMMLTERLLILPFSDLRGFDTTGMNAIVAITECQNTDRELLKLAIQRVSNDSKLILEGDSKTQLDMDAFRGSNNGMDVASRVFRGQPYYAELELQRMYRSIWGERAEMMSTIEF